LAVFVASIYYFSRDIKEVVFDIDNTTVMEDATFPLITIKTGENKINQLHGYSSNLKANRVREALTPIGNDQTFTVLINQEDYVIKKLNYEVREFVGNDLIETDSLSVFEDEEDLKSAKISIKAELSNDREYAVKITLITSESLKMYYYHRIKKYENTYLNENLTFVMDFHNAIKNKESAQSIIDYLESNSDADNSSLAYVNIYSSFELITWGNLEPVFVTEVIPRVKEVYKDTAMVELDYFIETDIQDVKEHYQVTEFYRVRYSKDRMFLLNYERRMEALFDVNLASVIKSELKLGITNNPDLNFLASADKKKLVFVRNRELWFYDLEKNEMIQVFSFRQEQTDYLRDLYNQHNIKLLNMDAEGNVNFLVYGYMNRGQYEGKVAVVLYKYIRMDDRIEELVYIPAEQTYQTLKENLGDFTYVNGKEIFYFHMNETIYAYNLITRELSVLASEVPKSNIVVLEELNYVSWQENPDPSMSKSLSIMNMETGEIQTIQAPTGYNIRLLGKIDSNIIYGYLKAEDIMTMMDGRRIAPPGIIEIASVDNEVLKSYQKQGYYISEIKVTDNVIDLIRLQKVENNGHITYIPAANDYIMNQVKDTSEVVSVNTRVTDQLLTEFYMTLPGGFTMTEVPKVKKTVQTVITQDPTVRQQGTELNQIYYYPYITGGIGGAYVNAADAIKIAREGIGTVLDSNNRLIWERGIKVSGYTIPGFETISWDDSGNTIESCLEIMLSYQGVNVKMEDISVSNQSAYEVLLKASKYTPIRLTGVTLEDALYYVTKGRPVLAMADSENSVLIYGFDAFNITVINPKTGKKSKMGMQDSTSMFSDAGNVFISYLGQ
jgi:hypothetical protein